MLPICDYEFEVKGIYDVDIPEASINISQNGNIRFYGTARVNQFDPTSVATFVTEDVYRDEYLSLVRIEHIKLPKDTFN